MSNLPFLKKERPSAGGVITEYRKPDGDEPNEDAPLESCAQDLIRCSKADDHVGVAKALRAAFEILDSQPHEEAEHTNEDKED